MDTMVGMKVAVAVVETGSFTAAGERLGISKALVSKYINQVEANLNVRLFNRSTRRLAITESGQNFYDRSLLLLEEYEDMLESMAGDQTLPKGLIKISAPVSFGENNLAPLLPKFNKMYPDLSIHMELSNKKVDMLEEGIDVRIRIGGVDDSNLIARKINSEPLWLCAAPAYLEKFGTPTSPEQLSDHNCVIDSNFSIGTHWPFVLKDVKGDTKSETTVVEVKHQISANSPVAVKNAAMSGGGICLSPQYVVQNEIESEALVRLLPKYSSLEFTMYAIYPHRRYLPKKVRCFVDFLLEEFSDNLR
jgi:DNA-binding transcriptional LysR family regulator